jgi:methyl-accepting chemotaxis protein
MISFLANLKISYKMFMGPFLVILFLIFIGFISYLGHSSQKVTVEDIFINRFKSYQTTASILKDMANVHANLYKVISWANAKYDEKKIEVLGKEQLAVIAQGIEVMEKKIKSMDPSSEETKRYQASLAGMVEYKNAAFSAVDLAGSDLNMATMYMSTTDEKYQVLYRSLQDLLALEDKLSQEKYDFSSKSFDTVIKTLVIALGIAVGLSLLTNIFITRLMTSPIRRTIGVIQKIADGDLTQEISQSSKDEIGELAHSVNVMRLKMNEAVGQSMATSQTLAKAASEQAASLEETSSSLEEMASMTKKNAENTNQANQLMAVAQEATQTANRSMNDLTHSMEEVAQASEQTQKVVKSIDEIAFQTNLLALNAAVEAARAGEAGAGFAVVAGEVRNLAMRAAEAAKNTANLMNDIVEKIKAGESMVTVTNKEFQQVGASSKKVVDLMGEISAASQEQSQGIDQINKAVAEMSKVTQQNAASAQELASIMASFKVKNDSREASFGFQKR